MQVGMKRPNLHRYYSVQYCLDTGHQIPPSLPLQKVPPFAGFGKEGQGEIFGKDVFSIMDSLVIVPSLLVVPEIPSALIFKNGGYKE